MKDLVTNILAANRGIKAVDGGVRETPLDESGVFSERTGTTFLLKAEHLQRTGSFKLRGALNKVACFDPARASAITYHDGEGRRGAAMLSLLEISAFLLVLSAAFGWLNVRFLKLPHTIGLLLTPLPSFWNAASLAGSQRRRM